MKKSKIYKFLQSLVAVPILTVIIPFNGTFLTPSAIVGLNQDTADYALVITTPEAEIRKAQAEKIDAFFASYDAPLEGYGMKFVEEAYKNDIDWRLLPAIAMRESTGGKHACKRATNSVFGYGSCKMNFKSIDESIEIVARSLGGNHPNTAHYYEGKTTLEILRKYNSVIPNYPKQVVKIMEMISESKDIA